LGKRQGKKLLVIVGPTGVGKTEVACILGRRLGGEVVSADSRQIYRGMDIGTGKPSREQLASVKHHMIDVADPAEAFDAARFAGMARDCIEEIRSRGATPMLVGGTGFYVKATLYGLAEAPGRDEGLRERLRAEESRRPGSLYERLQKLDPVRARELSPNDLVRIVRALEIIELTGRPASELRRRSAPDPVPHVAFGLIRPRSELYRAIDARVDAMVEAGLFEEVEELLRRGVPEWAPGLRTIGYREAIQCLKGRLEKREAIEAIKRNSRRYAKRQLTWFRRTSVRRWISVSDPGQAALAIEAEYAAALGRG